MPSRNGQFHEGSDAEVPHPEGVRDLKRLRRDLAETLYREGAPGKHRRRTLSDLVVQALAAHWDEASGGIVEGAALGAVGSLGRGDAGPFSDLDVVLIHDGRTLKSTEVADLAQRLWYPIWDAGLELDYSSRSLTEVRQVASKDLAAASGLLDLRPIAGDKELAKQARALIYQDWRAAARKRLPELLAASRARAERHGELAYLIEPNLKESRGGLRDLVSLTGLSATWLTDRPHGAVDDAGAHVMDVRDAIQMHLGRTQNVLGRHIGEEVAEAMGFGDPDDLLASLAEAGREIAYALDMTERGARRSLERSGVGSRAFLARRRARAPRHTVVAEGLIDVDGELALAPGHDAAKDALLPLRAAATAATTGLTITPTLLETLQRCPDLPVPWPPEAREYLRELLRGSAHLIAVWEAIDLAGLVVRALPEWEGVRNRPQRSPIHRFTVDRHMVESVVLAAKARRYEVDHDLLRLTLLVHDIGKRPGATDHSVDGAALIPGIAARMGLEEGIAADMELLVRQHLTLADLATTADPDDPETVERLLVAVDGRLDLLDTLRALTECDAKAAGPKAWTQWREQLVQTLYVKARAVLIEKGGPTGG
ncbi:HD domain-containing protein [Demequina zhanjiangensis]|uniref:Nucleotidyltransferase domain-containing protein n=1 Tax=Demequina zhanjiangensis TaxID=3051659 RepID=A0ABT8G3F2_9MICO|nr:HD domain-containing protein [Demequina sp. SYSU T00b26]MDN4473542.1 nucleotidyltransferase domain-containing protein [Demequina sp. SYSU T00b26]